MFQSSNSGGLFGSGSNTSSNLFGAKPAGGTGFGSNSNASAAPAASGTGFGFGANNNANSTNSATNNTSGGGLFGSSNQASNSTGFGSNFANNASSGSTGFGASSGGLFGSNNNNNTNTANSTSGGLFGAKPAAPASSGGLFGSNSAQPAAQNSTSGGLFGAKPAAPASGGLFGNNNNTSTTSGGLFGGNNNNSTTSGGLFGAKPAASAPASGGLFGASNQSNTSGTTGGLFGQQNQQNQQNQQPQNQTSGGLFSSNNTTNNAQPSFNWSTNQAPAPTNLFNPITQNTANVQEANQNNTYKPAINDQITKIKEQWDPNSPKCALKTHFYNKFNEQEINVLLNQQRPANESHEDWEKAMNKRPSPAHYPIKITSFTEVAQRIETQLDHVAKSRLLLNDLNEKANNLSAKHDLDNTARISKAKAKHTKLSRRLLRLATVLAILKLKGYPLLPEEEEISKQFELLNAKLNDPNNPIGKLNDIFARLATLKERAEDLNYQFDNSINSFTAEDENVSEVGDSSNQEVFKKLSKVLMKQQIGLNYLNEVLDKDFSAIENVK